jgi:hypothetical protein
MSRCGHITYSVIACLTAGRRVIFSPNFRSNLLLSIKIPLFYFPLWKRGSKGDLVIVNLHLTNTAETISSRYIDEIEDMEEMEVIDDIGIMF